MNTDIAQFCTEEGGSILDIIACMDSNKLGIVLVVDQERRLVGTVTDGDIRRAILAKVDLNQPASLLLARKVNTRYEHPITALVGLTPETCLSILKQHSLLHLPIVDAQRRVVGLVTPNEFLPDEILSLHAVVMAGGRGSRLFPLTKDIPKPMLRVGDQPLLEIIVRQLREAGIRQVKITTHHKPEEIKGYFGDGKNFGVQMTYVQESQPLGTVGSLGLLQPPKETTLVMNGDILTQIDFRAMLVYHREHQADLTVGVRHYDLKVPYGVVECDGPVVKGVNEKPVFDFFVNAGIYLLEPAVYHLIPNGRPLDMTDLIQRLLDQDRPVVSFPIREYWLDIGEHAEYQRAEDDVRAGKVHI